MATTGETIAVGAFYDDDDGGESGSVYIYEMPAEGWTDTCETAKLTASDGQAGDQFGYSVILDGTTLAVGAIQNPPNPGHVYVFTYEEAVWVEEAKLSASVPVSDGELGTSVSVYNDTVVAGALQDDVAGVRSGSAYVFVKPLTGWENLTETAKLTPSDGAAMDFFGSGVSMYGDTILAGAPRQDDSGADSGCAYVFQKPSGGWTDMTETAKILPSDGQAGAHFNAVGLAGTTGVIGAHTDDNFNGIDAGAAYVFNVAPALDCDGDGICNGLEIATCDGDPACGDCNLNGVPDGCESDCDGDGLINDCDPDIDDDGVSNEDDVCDYTPPSDHVEPDGSLLGDFDGDCDVDLRDFAEFQIRFTGPACSE